VLLRRVFDFSLLACIAGCLFLSLTPPRLALENHHSIARSSSDHRC
jgi:hypothetical protein